MVRRSSEGENITSSPGCTDFLFFCFYGSKVEAMWLHASVCSVLLDFLIDTYILLVATLSFFFFLKIAVSVLLFVLKLIGVLAPTNTVWIGLSLHI